MSGMNLSLYSVNAFLILDTEGSRVLAKYYRPKSHPLGESKEFLTLKEQKAFEKGLWQKTKKPGGDIILYDGHLAVYKHSLDLIIYFIAGPSENELMLSTALNNFVDALTMLLRNQIEKRGVLESLDMVLLCLDETIDDGIIVDTDPTAIASRVSRPRPDTMEIVINEQSIMSAYQTVKEKMHLSPAASSTRFSLPSIPGTPGPLAQSRPAGVRPNIYDRNLNKTRITEVSGAAFTFLFSEIVQYTQKRVSGINDLERRLNTLGYRIGTRVLELMVWRAESASKAPKREIRLLPALMSIHTQVWRAVFGKPADAIEKSVENADEYMIIDNDPLVERYISVPKDISQLSCSSFTAGIVEAVLDGLGFPARVTAHNTPNTQFPSRTTILIKLEKSVLEREEVLKG
ncbi:trafficking protein particle complex subunit [Favolaschia claudopus]|uniref:Zeta-coat protein n=1 Tax=Favolaschia claudopus TaxID=2862362 RepID=A0AAW0ANY8_9AGAR